MNAGERSDGYRFVTKLLHWSTVTLLLVQFVVGYLMEDDSGHGRGRGRGGDALASGRGRGRGGDDDVVSGLLPVHVGLGVTILLLAAIRVASRRATTLPPWAPSLSPAERRIAHVTERALLTLLFVVPASGIGLVLVDDDLLPLHVAAHVAFFAALAAHLGLVLGHRLRTGQSLLARMT